MAGVLTGADLLVDMRLNLGSPDTTIWSDTVLLRDINRAYITDICSRFDHPELDSTISVTASSATAAVSLSATDYLKINHVTRVTDSFTLERISRLDYSNLAGYLTTTSGAPDKWWATGEASITVYPLPDKDYALYVAVRLRPADLTDATATVINSAWDEPLTAYAHARLAMRLRLYEDAKAWREYGDQCTAGILATSYTGTEMQRLISGQTSYKSEPR